jgi:hypothetical protein
MQSKARDYEVARLTGPRFLISCCHTLHEPIDQGTGKETHADDHPCEQ